MPVTDLDNEAILNKIKEGIGSDDERARFDCLVEGMLNSGKAVYHHNRRPWQTAKVVSEIFAVAKETLSPLKIFIGDVNCECYGINWANSIREVAEATSVEIVLADKPSREGVPAWKDLNSNEQVTVRYKDKYSKSLNHLIMTGSAYRVEAVHEKLPTGAVVNDMYPERPARFAFNSPRDVAGLSLYWDDAVLKDTIPLDQVN